MRKTIQQDELNSGIPIPRETLVSWGLKKVPEVTIFFWIIKLLTTAMGEATSDFLIHLNPVLALAFDVVALTAVLVLQFRVRRYVPWIYWLAVLTVAVVGTVASDALHGLLAFSYLGWSSLSYLGDTMIYLAVLTIIFVVWYLSEKTLSIHSITTRRHESFYWATVMATFALGTAVGDLTASLGLGFLGSIVLFAALLTLPALGYRLLGLNEVLTFWFAYILTRPLGASIADWVGKEPAMSGLGVGDGPVCLVLGILIIGFVGYVTLTHNESRERAD